MKRLAQYMETMTRPHAEDQARARLPAGSCRDHRVVTLLMVKSFRSSRTLEAARTYDAFAHAMGHQHERSWSLNTPPLLRDLRIGCSLVFSTCGSYRTHMGRNLPQGTFQESRVIGC